MQHQQQQQQPRLQQHNNMNFNNQQRPTPHQNPMNIPNNPAPGMSYNNNNNNNNNKEGVSEASTARPPNQTLIQPPSGYVSTITMKQDQQNAYTQPPPPYNAFNAPLTSGAVVSPASQQSPQGTFGALCTPWIDPTTTGTAWANSKMSTTSLQPMPSQQQQIMSNVSWGGSKGGDDGNNNNITPPTIHYQQQNTTQQGGGRT